MPQGFCWVGACSAPSWNQRAGHHELPHRECSAEKSNGLRWN